MAAMSCLDSRPAITALSVVEPKLPAIRPPYRRAVCVTVMDDDYDRKYLLGRIRVADDSDALAGHASWIRVYDQLLRVVQSFVCFVGRKALVFDVLAAI